jgi:hypothetical protein
VERARGGGGGGGARRDFAGTVGPRGEDFSLFLVAFGRRWG